MNCKQILTWLDPVLETQWTPAYHITFSVISPGQAVKKKKYNWQFFHILSGVKDKCAFIKIKYNSDEKNVCLIFFIPSPTRVNVKIYFTNNNKTFSQFWPVHIPRVHVSACFSWISLLSVLLVKGKRKKICF